jgi:hypothetical protein
LPLGGDGILDALEMLPKDEGYRSPAGGIPIKSAGLVFTDT